MVTEKQKLLITGAAGRIGQRLTEHWRNRYDLVLTDKRTPEATHGFSFTKAGLEDLAVIRPLFSGVHTVIHLANDANPRANWESLLPNNMIANYNVFQAAVEANCQRVIFASSVNAVAGYPADVQIKTDMPVAPPNLYGATKAWGEALGRFYADQKGLSVLCLRLGAVMQPDDKRFRSDYPLLDIALTYADLLRLFDAALAATHVKFGTFHGISNNRFKRLDISDTRLILGYEPKDDAYVLAGVVGAERPDHLFENR
jgi:NAD(P)-dependent dehydrogenase (short-subunit alcohol dehydrogenase family)